MHEPLGDAGGHDDAQRARAVQLLLDPPRHDDVGQVDEVVAVHVRDEHGGHVGRADARLDHPQRGGATRIELQCHVAAAHHRAGASRPGLGCGTPVPVRITEVVMARD